ncbi:alpha/beta hydrolase fold family protein [Mycobacterium xenopi 3993]|nr:alpha/beta hydrolase fold family protein [Mycobacterium xenopi 3993]
MVMAIARPKLEGNIAVGEDRQLGFAEFGDPQGRAIFWLHGTPGARRQIPVEARVYAEQKGIRLIGVDRPGIGSSTPHQYPNVLAFADDLRTVADTLGIDKMAVVGLSGGGPYTLACGRRCLSGWWPSECSVGWPRDRPGRRPWRCHDPWLAPGTAARGGRASDQVCRGCSGLAGAPGGPAGAAAVRTDVAGGRPAPTAAARVRRDVPRRPAQRQPQATRRPFADIVVFARDWGFRLEQVKVPVRWWHGDHDHIVPFAHGQHVVSRLPDAELYHLPGESHLAGLGRGEEILRTMMEVWDRAERK